MGHVIRDPVYGYVDIEEEEKFLLDTPALQRLRRIRQLARADLVYPSLMHTRFEHSIGVMHVASEMHHKLGADVTQRKIIRATALLHDIGHGPFSHVFENAVDFDHEDITRRIITEDEGIRSSLLKNGITPEDIIDILDHESLSHEIISSPLDADKIDYLLRDSHHAGVSYGMFDYHRLMHTLCKGRDSKKEYLCVLEKGAETALSFVVARHLMHMQVYHHHVRIITDNMLLRGIEHAKVAGILPEELFDPSKSGFLECYMKYDDDALANEIISGKDTFSREIFLSLRNRRLFKRAFGININQAIDSPRRKRLEKLAEDRNATLTLEKKIADSAAIDPGNVIVHVLTEKNPLCPYIRDEREILIKMETGQLKDLSEVLPFQTREPLTIRLYVLCPDRYKIDVQKHAQKAITEY